MSTKQTHFQKRVFGTCRAPNFRPPKKRQWGRKFPDAQRTHRQTTAPNNKRQSSPTSAPRLRRSRGDRCTSAAPRPRRLPRRRPRRRRPAAPRPLRPMNRRRRRRRPGLGATGGCARRRWRPMPTSLRPGEPATCCATCASCPKTQIISRKKWPCGITWLHFGVDEHPFATYFGVHQGYRVLAHS